MRFFNHRIWLLIITAIFAGSFSVCYAENSLTLSLEDAILLAVRENPNVQSQRLGHLVTELNLKQQLWEFSPHYGLSVTGGFSKNQTGPEILRSQDANFEPKVSLKTAYGTNIDFAFTNKQTTHYNPGLSLDVSQPLMRGFGKSIVLTNLNNARDDVNISRLRTEGILRATVTDVIDAYLDVISAERSVKIDEDALKRARISVEQTKKFIKAGNKAGTELVTVQADVASSQAQLENDRNSLIQSKYSLLAIIGLNPTTDLKLKSLDFFELEKKYPLPSLPDTKARVLLNDIQYQIDLITFHGTTARSLRTAVDNTRPELNFTMNALTGKGIGGNENANFESLWNGYNQGTTVRLTLNVPIDDVAAKQAVQTAKIGIQQAEIALRSEKWRKETDAINGWNQVLSAERYLRLTRIAEELQQKTYNLNYKKYVNGLIDSLQLQTAQVQLIQAQAQLLRAQISYIKALVNLDAMMGNTLNTWHIKVRL